MSWRRGQAYAQDLRDRILNAQGSLSEVAQRFAVSVSYVSRVRTRKTRLGQTCPGAQRNHMPLRLEGRRQELMARVTDSPNQTLAELCQWVQTTHALAVVPSTMHKTLKRFGLTFKKKRSTPASSSAPT